MVVYICIKVNMRLIKKYKNRRLYDTEKSQYITIEDLKRYVVDGIQFQVQDANSKVDITTNTLLQILVEMEMGPQQFLSADVLRQLICLANHPLNQSFKSLLENMLSAFEKQMAINPYVQNYKNTGQTINKQVEQLFSQWQDLFKG